MNSIPMKFPKMVPKERTFIPTNVIDYYQKKASEIEYINNNNYKYTYWVKTPNGMRLDDEKNHSYGDDREGYEKWKDDNPDLFASYGGQISLRTLTSRENNRINGYITEERLSDSPWKKEIEKLSEECFEKLCEELNVVDIETFKYFVFNDSELYKDYKSEIVARIDDMVDVYNRYQCDDDYKKMVDKIKE